MAKTEEKGRVQELRRNGMSIRDISKITKNSKSTVSYWCRDIILTKRQLEKICQKQKIASLRSVIKITEKKRRKRLNDIENFRKMGIEDVGKLSERDIFVIGLGLYWGEGYKKGTEELGFTNSDPKMILFFIEWLKKIYNVGKQDLTLRLSINIIHKQNENEIKKKWSNLTKIPINQFTKTSLIKAKSKKIYFDNENYLGTLRIKVRRGTNLRRRILGSVNALTL